MKFEQFLNEKLADNLSPEQMDYYWKAIHAYNSWKKNQKNSMKVKNMLSFILMNFDLDDRATAKITNLKNTVEEYIKNGNLVIAPIKHREKKEEEPETKQEITIDESDYQTIEIDKEFCEKAFDKFNQKYFEGKLAKVPFELKPLSGLDGQFGFTVNYRDKKFEPNVIRICAKDTWTLSTFRNTLVHEMLHYYVHCYNNGLTDFDWQSAFFWYIRGKKRKANSILEVTDATCHGGIWLKTAKALNKKYPELSITRNGFVSYRAEPDKIKVINQLKEAYAVELLYLGSTKFPRYRLVNKEQFDKIMSFIKESPTVKLDEYGSLDYTDPTTNFISDLSISYRNPNDFTDVYAAQIINPVKLAEFPIRDLDKEPYSMGKEEWKQMNHTQAFGKFKKLGTIKIKRKENESKEEPNFLNWLNEKVQKKWDIEKLKALGLTDEEIEKLLSGEVEEQCMVE